MTLHLKETLLTGITLVVISTSAAHATDNVITGSTPGPLTLDTGDTLTVNNGGSLSTTGQDDIQVTGTPAGTIAIHSGGSIGATSGNAISVTSGDTSAAITNNGSVTASGASGDRAIEVDGTVSGGINNNSGATISGDGHALEVSNGAITADGNGNAVYNDGTISSTGNANFPDSSAMRLAGATITGNIFNDTNGIISGHIYGINLQSGTSISGGLTNLGTISGGVHAIWVDGGTLANGITNNSGGVIGNGAGDGIYVNSGSTLGQVTNNGTISSTSGDAVYNGGSLTTLTNASGTISATTGIALQNAGSITTLSNTGTIASAGSYGINNSGTISTLANNNGGTVSGTGSATALNNNGGTIGNLTNAAGATITAAGYTISNNGNITTLTNGGAITATGGGGYAITNYSTIGTLTNTGTISGGELGIYASGAITNFNNSGTITALNGTGYAAIDIAGGSTNLNNSGTIAGTSGRGLISGDNNLAVTNSGTISATTGTAIELDAALTGNLTNTGGLITSASTGNGTFYVNANINSSWTITGGTISNTSTSNSAVAFNIAVAQGGQITFSNVNLIADGDTAESGHGTALANGTNHALVNFVGNSVVRGNIVSGGALTLDVNDAAITGNVTLGGTGNELELLNTASIKGATAFGTGVNSAIVASYFTTQGAFTTAAGGQTNFTVYGGSFTANNAVGFGSGALTVDNGAALNLVAADVATTGAFTNHGTTSIGVGHTLSVGSLNTVPTDGVLSFTANNLGSTLLTGHINTGATAANLSNQTVSVNYIGGIGLSSASRSLIASGTGNATAPTAAVIDNSYLYGFSIAQGASDPNDLYLQASLLVSPTDASNTQNNANAANILFSPTINSNDPVINQIQTNLLNAPTRQAYNNVVQSTLPTVDHGAPSGAANFTGDVFDVADSQLTTVDTGLQTGIAAGNETHALHPWMQGFGSYAQQGMRSDVPGYDAATYGAAFGIDTRELVEGTVLGLSFAYGRTNVNSNNTNNTTTNVNTYQGMIYGNHTFAEDYFVTGMGAFGWDTNNETRQNVGAIAGLNAGADYSSWQAATRWEVGRNFRDLPTNMTFAPSLIGDYLHYQANGYTESGAGGADLHLGSQAENQLNLGLGLQAEWLFEAEDGSKLRPNLHGSYKYNVLNNDAVDTTSSFAAGGGTFTTHGLNPENSTYDLGTGMKFYNTGNWDFTATYDHTFKADYNSDSGIVRAAYQF